MEEQEHVDGGHGEGAEATGPTDEEVHRLLAAERRRFALELLADGGPWELEELAEAVVERERQGDVTERAVRRTMVDLYHRHLPLMADLEAVEFDHRRRRVVGLGTMWEGA